MKSYALLLALLFLPAAQDPPKKETPEPKSKFAPVKADLMLRGARIWTGLGKPIDNGVILIYKGRIVAVGPRSKVPTPTKCKTIDLKGKVVIPGLIDTGSYLFLRRSEMGSAGAGDYRVIDAVDYYQEDYKEALRNGVTTVYILPASRGMVNGRGAVLHMSGPKSRSFVLRSAGAVHMTLAVSSGDTTTKLARFNAHRSFKRQLESIKKYKESWEKYAKDLTEYKKKKKAWDRAKRMAELRKKRDKKNPPKPGAKPKAKPPAPKPEPKKPRKPRFDPQKDVLRWILDTTRKQLSLRLRLHHADSIEFALELAKEFKLKLILDQATEAHKVVKKIAAAKVPVCVGPVFRYGMTKVDYMDHSLACSAALSKGGVVFAIGSFPESNAGHRGSGATRFLSEAAACAMSEGLSAEAALASVTSSAATILGLQREVGSIAKGRRADLVVLTGDPFKPDSRVEKVFIDGKVVYTK